MTDIKSIRRDLMTKREEHKGNMAITTRITDLLSQIANAQGAIADQRANLYRLINKNMAEIAELTAQSGKGS